MSTGRFKRVLELYRNYGPIYVYKELVKYVSNVVMQGGLSSRPMIENISGVFRPALNFLFNVKYNSGIDVYSEDWDNL
ncbi:MAG: hypothetical protein ABEI86_09135, partial [Halobacteriaceae archaeon]